MGCFYRWRVAIFQNSFWNTEFSDEFLNLDNLLVAANLNRWKKFCTAFNSLIRGVKTLMFTLRGTERSSVESEVASVFDTEFPARLLIIQFFFTKNVSNRFFNKIHCFSYIIVFFPLGTTTVANYVLCMHNGFSFIAKHFSVQNLTKEYEAWKSLLHRNFSRYFSETRRSDLWTKSTSEQKIKWSDSRP